MSIVLQLLFSTSVRPVHYWNRMNPKLCIQLNGSQEKKEHVYVNQTTIKTIHPIQPTSQLDGNL